MEGKVNSVARMVSWIKQQMYWRQFSKALTECDRKTVERLIAKGFDINDRDAFASPVGYAVAFGCLEILTGLLDKGAKMPEATSHSAGVMVADAVKTKNAEILSLLLSHGLSPNALEGNPLAMTPLMWAITIENTVAVQLLLNYGAEISPVDHRGKTAGDYAAARHDPLFAELLQNHSTEKTKQ